MEFRIRQAVLADRPTLLRFHRALYIEHRSSLMPDGLTPLYAYRGFERVLSQDIDAMIRNPSTALLVAEVGSQQAPSAVAYVSGHVETDARRELSRKGIVGDWFVESEHRGSGIGRALLDALMAIFREAGCSITEIATWPFNTDTRAAIEKLGFDEVQITYRRALDPKS